MKNKLVRPQPPARRSSLIGEDTLSDQVYGALVSQAPSLGQIYDKGIVFKFLEFFSRNARRSSWTLKLPDLENNPGAHALRSSLRAVSLAYTAHVTKNDSVRYEAYRQYGRSLQRQRTTLMVMPMTSDMAAATNALLAMVILSYFELISGIAPSAWIEHTTAAERLMVMLGPDALRHEIIGQLFYSIRSHSVQRAAIYGQYSPFSEPLWLEQNLAEVLPRRRRSVARNHYDILVEYVLRLSRYVHGYERFSADNGPGTMLEELERLYEHFLTVRGLRLEDAPLLKPKFASEWMRSVGDASHALHPSMHVDFPAMTVCYFHIGAIMLLAHVSVLGRPHYDLAYNAATIIAAGKFLSRPGGSNGVAVLRMMLPFSSIWCFVNDQKVKLEAKKMFVEWSAREGLGGLCGIGFPRPYTLPKTTAVGEASKGKMLEAGTRVRPWGTDSCGHHCSEAEVPKVYENAEQSP